MWTQKNVFGFTSWVQLWLSNTVLLMKKQQIATMLKRLSDSNNIYNEETTSIPDVIL